MNFPLHNSIKNFKNNNFFPSIFNLFFRPFRKDFQRNVKESIQMPCILKEEFKCSFHFGKFWSLVTWIDCNCIGNSLTLDFASLHVENEAQGYK